MSALLLWATANPLRAFLAAGTLALATLVALPIVAWLPASIAVLALLANERATSLAAFAGAALALVWSFAQLFGLQFGLAMTGVILLPSMLAALLLARTRSLTLVFQALTVAACLLVVAIHALLGEVEGVLRPLIAALKPDLERMTEVLSRFGLEQMERELTVTAQFGWGVLGWLTLLYAMLAQFAALWAFGRRHMPGLFGREFRTLRLGRSVAWLFVAGMAASVLAHRLPGHGWQAIDDVVFVLASAFLLQALAVAHGLRELQVIGLMPVVLAYVAAAILPVALVGIGLADTWIRFRERFAPRQGV